MNSYKNDEWTLVDTLGYEGIIKQIYSIITEASAPFALGVYGGWGSGKTSIMKQLYFRMGGQTASVLFPFADKPH
ncbi:MAG: P-loop NTPase fold protein [Spirochaetota bacterium]